MYQAVWHGAVLAESDRTVRLEGDHYFPPESLHREYFVPSATTSVCPRKGAARYYDVAVDGSVNRDAARCYPRPNATAGQIGGHVAFSSGVEVVWSAADAGGADGSVSRPGSPVVRARAFSDRCRAELCRRRW